MKAPSSKNQYPLTGLIFCGKCGCPMGGGRNTDKTVRYVCTGYSAGKCERRTVKQDEILPEVLRQIRVQFFDTILSPGNRKLIADEIHRAVMGESEEANRQRQRDEGRLEQLEAELEQAVSAMIATSEDLRPLVEGRVRTLQDERDAAADRLKNKTAPTSDQVRRMQERIDSAMNWLDQLEAAVDTEYDPEHFGRVLRLYIDRIEVDTERTGIAELVTDQDFLTAKEIGEVIGVDAGTVRRWATKPGFPLKRPDGSYDAAAVRVWLAERPRQRHDVRLTGGRIYFQAGALAQCVDMLNPPGRWST